MNRPFFLFLCLANAACGSAISKANDAGDTGSPTSADQACFDSAYAMCTKMITCAPNAFRAAYPDPGTCDGRLQAVCIDALSARSNGNTADKTEACAQAYATYDCTDYRNKTNIPAACQQATGSLAAGEPCLYSGQCSSGFCAIAPGAACGQCAVAPPQRGDSCAQLTSCGPTLSCTTDTQVCTAFAAQGQACGAGQPCGAGLSCVAPGGAGTAGTCQPAGTQVGTACDVTERTAAGCDSAISLYCDGLTKQCATMSYAASDTEQDCGYNQASGTFVACSAAACASPGPPFPATPYCIQRAFDNARCANVPDLGAATPSAGCLPPARCIAQTGTCQLVTAASCM